MKIYLRLLLVLLTALVALSPASTIRINAKEGHGARRPRIRRLTPAAGRVGAAVTILGEKFGRRQESSTVTFSGRLASVTSWKPEKIVVSVPPGATSGPVVITRRGVPSVGVPFTVIPTPPVITSVSPGSGTAGQSVIINGTNFGATRGSNSVTFNGLAASAISSWTDTSITASVPAAATSGPVVVTVAGLVSNGVAFTVIPPPVITSVNPASGPVGQVVTISGTGFGAAQGSGAVAFNGLASTSIMSWTDTAITAVVPAAATSGPVVVTANGLPSNGMIFTVIRPPVISSVNPLSRPAGYSVTIAGTNFGAAQGASTVTFNGVVATAIASWTDTSITANVPDAATSGPLAVTVNGLASNAVYFTVMALPVITSITPATGAAGQTVTIAGLNFGSTQGSSGVTFNGAPAGVTSWSATAITATVLPAATTGPVVVTVNGYVSNGVTFTVIGPRISATLSPQPDAFGWNISNVVVTFTCTATTSPISFCTSPQTVSWSGAGIRITGRAVDQSGVTATMTATLNVDLAGPTVHVYSPAMTAVFPPGTTTVTIGGSAVDVTSGLASVTCAGIAATIVGQNFTCAASVQSGTTSVHLEAQDLAGRVTAQNIAILVADVAPASIAVSPATMTLLAGYGQPLAVLDERGRTVTGGAWTTSDQNVAAMFIDDGIPTVHALAAGTATVTLTRDGLSAQAVVTVLAADATPPDGTTLWSLTATPNPQPWLTPGVREIVRAVPMAVRDNSAVVPPALFFVEHGPYYQDRGTTALPTVVRAASADGREVWKYTLPPDPTFGGYAPVKQVAPDDRGGVVLVVSSSQPVCCYRMNEVIRRLDGLTGEVSWEYWHRETFGRFSEIAIHPDGTVFVVEKLSHADSTDLVAIDGVTGQETGRYDLTAGHTTYPNASNATGPIVQDDGSVVAVVSRWDNQNSFQTTPKSAWLATLPDGAGPASLSLQPLVHADGTPVNLGIGDIMSGPWPDGHGGFIVGDISPLQTSGFADVVHVGADLVTSATVDLPFGASAARELQYVLGEDAAYVLVQYWQGSAQTGATSYKLNPQTLAILSSTALSGGPRLQLTSAMVGGGALFAGAAEGYATQVAQLAIAGVRDDGPLVELHTAVPVSLNLWSGQRGNLGRREARDLRRGIFIQGYPLYLGLSHSALRLIPKNARKWLADSDWGSLFLQDSVENWFVTLSAESSTHNCSGNLVSEVNRVADLVTPLLYFDRALYPNDREDAIIGALFQADANYHDDLPYDCIPPAGDGTYNSNSYAHGLVNATGLLATPTFSSVWSYWYPGWAKPVPPDQFRSH